MMKYRENAFTLIEVLVVLSILASLMTLSMFGFATLQRSGRDDLRRSKLLEIKQAVDSYYKTQAKLPGFSTNFVWTSSNLVKVGNKNIDLIGPVAKGSSTSLSQTRYYYTIDRDGFRLCALLESGTWYGAGTSSTACDSNPLVQ